MRPIRVFFIVFIILFTFSCKRNKTPQVVKEKVVMVNTENEELVTLPYFNTPDFTPLWLNPNSTAYNQLHTIPEFSFTNQNGEVVNNNTFKDKIYIADFFFTSCPSICLELTKQMHTLQELFKNDDNVLLISHTVMPWKDTVLELKDYGERNNVTGNKWHLVTGNKDKIYQLAREGYFADDTYKQTNDADRFIHTENFILVDKQGHIRGIYNGTLPIEIKRIKRHIELLQQEG